MKKKEAVGFTLVEALVTAIILSIIAVIGVTIFTMHNNQLRESNAMEKMQRQYDNVVEQIALSVRKANRVLMFDPSTPSNSDPVPTSFTQFPIPATPLTNVKNIRIYDSNGAVISEYSVAGSTFKESVNGALVDFEAGGSKVEIDPASSSFSLNNYRTYVEITLSLKTSSAGNIYYLPPRKDGFTCRNSPL